MYFFQRRRNTSRSASSMLVNTASARTVGFIVTTLTGTKRAVVRFYNRRGTAEQWIREGAVSCVPPEYSAANQAVKGFLEAHGLTWPGGGAAPGPMNRPRRPRCPEDAQAPITAA